MFTVYNIVAYQVAWFACVLGAAYGMPWIGAAVSFTVVAAHLALIGVAWGIAMLALSIVATRLQPASLPKTLIDEVRDARTQ